MLKLISAIIGTFRLLLFIIGIIPAFIYLIYISSIILPIIFFIIINKKAINKGKSKAILYNSLFHISAIMIVIFNKLNPHSVSFHSDFEKTILYMELTGIFGVITSIFLILIIRELNRKEKTNIKSISNQNLINNNINQQKNNSNNNTKQILKKFIITLSIIIIFFISLKFVANLFLGDEFPYKNVKYYGMASESEYSIRFLILGSLSWYDSTGNTRKNCDNMQYRYNKKTNILDLYCDFKKNDKIEIIEISKKHLIFKYTDRDFYYHYNSNINNIIKESSELSNRAFTKSDIEYYFINDNEVIIGKKDEIIKRKYTLSDFGDNYLELEIINSNVDRLYSYKRKEKEIVGLKEIDKNKLNYIKNQF